MQLSLSSVLAAHHSACEVKIRMFQLHPGHWLCHIAQEGTALTLGAAAITQAQDFLRWWVRVCAAVSRGLPLPASVLHQPGKPASQCHSHQCHSHQCLAKLGSAAARVGLSQPLVCTGIALGAWRCRLVSCGMSAAQLHLVPTDGGGSSCSACGGTSEALKDDLGRSPGKIFFPLPIYHSYLLAEAGLITHTDL